MRAVIQRCACCEVLSEGQLVGSVGQGLVIFLGIKKGDTIKDGIYIADKIMNLRIFEDEEGKLNKSILDVDGELMIVSQFTLYGDCRHGRRPSFFDAEEPLKANKLYEFISFPFIKIPSFSLNPIIDFKNVLFPLPESPFILMISPFENSPTILTSIL